MEEAIREVMKEIRVEVEIEKVWRTGRKDREGREMVVVKLGSGEQKKSYGKQEEVINRGVDK